MEDLIFLNPPMCRLWDFFFSFHQDIPSSNLYLVSRTLSLHHSVTCHSSPGPRSTVYVHSSSSSPVWWLPLSFIFLLKILEFLHSLSCPSSSLSSSIRNPAFESLITDQCFLSLESMFQVLQTYTISLPFQSSSLLSNLLPSFPVFFLTLYFMLPSIHSSLWKVPLPFRYFIESLLHIYHPRSGCPSTLSLAINLQVHHSSSSRWNLHCLDFSAFTLILYSFVVLF